MFNKLKNNQFINYFFNNSIYVRIFSFILLLFVWEVSAFLIKSDVLPPPKTVLIILFDEMIYGEMLYHLGITLWRVILAFTIAMLIGTGLGIAMGSKKILILCLMAGIYCYLIHLP